MLAVIGTVGPVVTLLLGWWLLQEPMHAAQWVGFALSLAGGVAVSFLKEC